MNPLTATIFVASLTLLILLAFGSPIIYTGWKQRQQYHQLSAIHTSLDDAIPGEAVAVSGTVSSRSRTIDSPYRSQRCALALWDTMRLSRGTQGSQWFLEASGVMADELLISIDTEHVPVTGLPQQRRVSTTAQTMSSALGVDVNSTLAFIDTELSQSGVVFEKEVVERLEGILEQSHRGESPRETFEKQFTPTEDLTETYRAHNREIGFDRPTRNSSDTLGRLLAEQLTPHNTVRYRELTFQGGDEITIIGEKTDDSISFVETRGTQPIISSESLSNHLSRYRLEYVLRLYGYPAFCLLFSALIAYPIGGVPNANNVQFMLCI